MRFVPALFALLLAPAVLAAEPPLRQAAEPPPPAGWEVVEMRFLLGTADHDSRLAHPHHHLADTGDFDGDGQEDVARLFVQRDEGVSALFVTLARDAAPWAHRLATVPLAEVVRLGVVTRKHGDFRTTCNMGVSDDRACGDVSEIGDHDNLSLFTFESAARVFWWTPDGFVSAWMSD